MLLLTFFAGLIIFYAYRVGVSPYGRLLFAIQDNEPLAKGLGKPTTRQKLVFFTVTSAAMGFIGAWYASATQFLVPQIIGASLTFTVWIALIVGGRKRVLGGALGVIVTVALFDIFVERYAELPPDYAQQLPNLKLMLYGLVLMLVILFRPVGLLGEQRVGRQ
jgi:ABC-type branched-subunit amino acid transport system permease subunit